MKKPSYIFFDLDDTLLDHKKAEKAALMETKSSFPFLNSISNEKLTDVYHKINKSLWHEYNHGRIDKHTLQSLRFANTLRELNLPVSVSTEVSEVYMNCYEKYWEWVEGASEVFDELASNYQVGILTNGFAETQAKKFHKFGLDKKVSHYVVSEEVGYLKPHPFIFDYATKLTGRAKDEIMYVGDSYNSDIEGGSSFGWQTAWFTKTNSVQNNPANLVFSDFKRLAEYLL